MIATFLFAAIVGAAAPMQGDITGQGITIGRGWYRFETYRGARFRWVDNDAVFTIQAPAARLAYVTIRAEGGPGLGTTTFPLRVLDAAGRQVDAVQITAASPRQLLILPVQPRVENSFRLHVDGGGKHAGKDPRVLNFRVFSMVSGSFAASPPPVASGPDVVEAGSAITLGSNWYPNEHYKGETFRWVDNNARFTVRSAKTTHAQLKLAVETGPGFSTPSFTLFLRDGSGNDIESAPVKDRTTVYFTIDLKPGLNEFVLHDEGGGKAAPKDARILNFRVFRIGLVS
jgi:hypothetical protein